ncbi:MAG: hypothetical protein JNM34_00630 [Chthonomonadaceae bacterium]|nr:hypothetical protein [Chthonomonadaceae bacterium]
MNLSGFELARLSACHAILCHGASLSDLEAIAVELAQEWMCVNGRCGECPVCRTVLGERAVDLAVFRPWGKAHLLKISALRPVNATPPDEERPPNNVSSFLRTPPLMAATKVVVLHEADRLNKEAANALLKILEEPPGFAKFVLTTTSLGQIVSTIRSRCLPFSVAPSKIDESDPLVTVFGGKTGSLYMPDDLRPIYQELYEEALSSTDAPRGGALAFAEKSRSIAEKLSKTSGMTSRSANAEVLRCLAFWAVKAHARSPGKSQYVVDAHKMVLGMVNPGCVFDSVWSTILA